MKVIVCLDDNNGMFFNNRRQSRDCVLRRDIMNYLQGARLWMNEYSEKQFEDVEQAQLVVGENFLEYAGEGDFCFVEDKQLLPYESRISELVVYYWNRKYPSDMYFDIDLSNWEPVDTIEFAGYSHEKITRVIYHPNS